MWIKELALYNIQAYENEVITFSKGINLVVGKNNTGKSTIIRSLLNFQNGQSVKPDQLLRRFSKEGYVLSKVEGIRSIPTAKVFPEDQISAIIFDAKNNTLWYSGMGEDIPKKPQEWNGYFDRLQREGELLSMQRFSDEEPGHEFVPFLSKRKPQHINGQFDAKAQKSIEHDLRNLPTKLSRASSNIHKEAFENACTQILNFMPSTSPGESGINMATIGHYVSADEVIPIDQMGDGVLQTLGLLIYLFQSRNKVFLIEEIENDLHPDALKKLLGEIIKSSKHNQFIISTHSNIVVTMLGKESDAKIFETKSKLEKDEVTGNTLFNSTIKEIGLSEDERINVLRDLGYELSDFHLWSAYLILEESSAEKLIKDFLIPEFCPGLINRLGTIGAKGASDVATRYSQLGSLFTFIHTSQVYREKAWVCVDNDDAGREAVKKMKDGFSKDWEPDHFIIFEKKDFEEYYPPEFSGLIHIIKQEQDDKKRGKLKVDLAKSVVETYRSKPELIEKFKESAGEVISILKRIEGKLLSP